MGVQPTEQGVDKRRLEEAGMKSAVVDESSASLPIEPLLTVDEVAKILKCSRAQVYALVAERSLQKAPLPYRTTRFSRNEIERLLRGEVA
jgi:excisionase family DNA binding protein